MTSATAISTLATRLTATSNLQQQQATLALLNQQLSSGQQHSDLTDYSPLDASNLMTYQNVVTQRNAYISGIKNVQSRVSLYDTTLSDIENIATQAGNLASNNQTYDSTKVAQIQAQATSYLQQMQDDLNQTLGGRYIYGGTRYTTQPVGNLATLGVPTLPFTPTTSPTLPDYSNELKTSNSFTITATPPTGNFQIGNSYIKWSDLAAGNVTTVYNTNGTTTSVSLTSLSAASTPTQLASNLTAAINQIVSAGTVSDFSSGLSATSSSGQVSLTYSGALTPITPDASGSTGQITWADTNDGTTNENLATTDAAAYAKDSVTVDNNYNLQYGVTSNDPGIQQVIAGLRLINAAASQTDPTVYKNYINQAATLLATGLNNVQTTHAGVAGSTNTLTQELNVQNTDINTLQTQIGNIQNVDTTSLAAQLSAMQTQLQASYSATASLLQESILKYL